MAAREEGHGYLLDVTFVGPGGEKPIQSATITARSG